VTRHPIIVVWLDAHADRAGGWVQPADIDVLPYTVITVGWLLNECKPDHISLAQSIGDDGALDHIIHIPAGMVIETRRALGEDAA
jgi:hypothetical protein